MELNIGILYSKRFNNCKADVWAWDIKQAINREAHMLKDHVFMRYISVKVIYISVKTENPKPSFSQSLYNLYHWEKVKMSNFCELIYRKSFLKIIFKLIDAL